MSSHSFLAASLMSSKLRICPRALYNDLFFPWRISCLLLRSLMPLPVVWPGPLLIRTLRSAGRAQHVNRPRAAASFCRDPPSPWVRFFGRPRRLTARRRSPFRSFSAPIASTFIYCRHASILFSTFPWFASVFSRQDSIVSRLTSPGHSSFLDRLSWFDGHHSRRREFLEGPPPSRYWSPFSTRNLATGQSKSAIINRILGSNLTVHISRSPAIQSHFWHHSSFDCMWIYTGFVFMAEFTGLFDIEREYTLQFTVTHTLVTEVTCSLPFSW
jgi:hypothetical protein